MEKFTPGRPRENRQYLIEGSVFIKKNNDLVAGSKEADILRMLRHKHIPVIYQDTVKNGWHSIMMSRCLGKPISCIKLNAQKRRLVASQLLETVAYLVLRGVVHGNICKENIVFDGKNILLVDWESAQENPSDPLMDIRGGPRSIINVLGDL